MYRHIWHNLKQTFRSTATLSTPQARLGVWLILSAVIYIVPVRWLENLSLYKAIGWESAPSIGLTRSYRLLLHGQFGDAWAMNPLIVAVLLIGMPLIANDIVKIIRYRQQHLP